MLKLNAYERYIYNKYAVEIRELVNSPWGICVTIKEAIQKYFFIDIDKNNGLISEELHTCIVHSRYFDTSGNLLPLMRTIP